MDLPTPEKQKNGSILVGEDVKIWKTCLSNDQDVQLFKVCELVFTLSFHSKGRFFSRNLVFFTRRIVFLGKHKKSIYGFQPFQPLRPLRLQPLQLLRFQLFRKQSLFGSKALRSLGSFFESHFVFICITIKRK